jgi:hypothetical protein
MFDCEKKIEYSKLNPLRYRLVALLNALLLVQLTYQQAPQEGQRYPFPSWSSSVSGIPKTLQGGAIENININLDEIRDISVLLLRQILAWERLARLGHYLS